MSTTVYQARMAAARCRSAIGKMLYGLRVFKECPSNWPTSVRDEMLEHVSANRSRLKSLYREFPEIRPIRTRQLDLFR